MSRKSSQGKEWEDTKTHHDVSGLGVFRNEKKVDAYKLIFTPPNQSKATDQLIYLMTWNS